MQGDLLKGIKIIDFTTYAAAPVSVRLLADWGADVIKVEGLSGVFHEDSASTSRIRPIRRTKTPSGNMRTETRGIFP